MSIRIAVYDGDIFMALFDDTQIYTITDFAFERLCTQDIQVNDLERHEIIDITWAEQLVLKEGYGQLDDFTTEGVTMN